MKYTLRFTLIIMIIFNLAGLPGILEAATSPVSDVCWKIRNETKKTAGSGASLCTQRGTTDCKSARDQNSKELKEWYTACVAATPGDASCKTEYDRVSKEIGQEYKDCAQGKTKNCKQEQGTIVTGAETAYAACYVSANFCQTAAQLGRNVKVGSANLVYQTAVAAAGKARDLALSQASLTCSSATSFIGLSAITAACVYAYNFAVKATFSVAQGEAKTILNQTKKDAAKEYSANAKECARQ